MVIIPVRPMHTLVEEADLSAVGTSYDRQHETENTIDAIISLSHIATISDNDRLDKELTKERIKFKSDPILAQVEDVSCVLDPEVLCDLFDEKIALSKFSSEVVSTTISNLQKPDCNTE